MSSSYLKILQLLPFSLRIKSKHLTKFIACINRSLPPSSMTFRSTFCLCWYHFSHTCLCFFSFMYISPPRICALLFSVTAVFSQIFSSIFSAQIVTSSKNPTLTIQSKVVIFNDHFLLFITALIFSRVVMWN